MKWHLISKKTRPVLFLLKNLLMLSLNTHKEGISSGVKIKICKKNSASVVCFNPGVSNIIKNQDRTIQSKQP